MKIELFVKGSVIIEVEDNQDAEKLLNELKHGNHSLSSLLESIEDDDSLIDVNTENLKTLSPHEVDSYTVRAIQDNEIKFINQ